MYRAWDKSSKKMLTGEQLVEEGLYISPANGNLVCHNNLKFFVMDKLILMRSAGQKDKNGKEIYEGDILAWNLEKYVVEWRGSGLYAINKKRKFSRTIKPIRLKIKVIGNIHDNPELQKE